MSQLYIRQLKLHQRLQNLPAQVRRIGKFRSFSPRSEARDGIQRRQIEVDQPGKANREEAWLDYSGWRVNYDASLLVLARITMAPSAPWTGARDRDYQLPDVFSDR